MQQAAQLASALAAAQAELAAASDASRSTQRQHDQAQAAADAMAAQVAAAKHRATASAAYAVALLRQVGEPGVQPDPLSAALTTPGDLLIKLGAVQRLRALSSEGTTAVRIAAHDAAVVASLQKKAHQADAAVTAIDVAAGVHAVSVAQLRVTAATAALAAVPTTIAAGGGWQALTIDPSVTATGWTLPLHGPLTDGFGPRPSRPAGAPLFHPGDDIGAACGTTMVAAAAGTVLAAGPNGGYGNFILIDHGGSVETAYGHIRDGGLGVTVGEHVAAGQPIAQVGSTGLSTGCHLHFEVRVNGIQIDPQPFMAARGVVIGTL